MDEVFTLFSSIAGSHYFSQPSLLVVFTKTDLFRQKIQSGVRPLKNYLPEYNGGPTDVEASQNFFVEKFRALAREENKELVTHFVDTTNTNQIRELLKSVQDLTVQRRQGQMIRILTI
jgi:guanine nucleotide-binding protein subunit alpha